MKKIKLTQGKYVLVDDSDFEWLNQWKWHYLSVGYAARRDQSNNKKYVYMHRLIMKANRGDEIDHVNLDTLDNRKANLRLANRSQNMANTNLRSTNTSGVKGVVWDKNRNKWYAEITVDYKNIYLGRFNDIEEAKSAYNQAAQQYFGEFARPNLL